MFCVSCARLLYPLGPCGNPFGQPCQLSSEHHYLGPLSLSPPVSNLHKAWEVQYQGLSSPGRLLCSPGTHPVGGSSPQAWAALAWLLPTIPCCPFGFSLCTFLLTNATSLRSPKNIELCIDKKQGPILSILSHQGHCRDETAPISSACFP